MRALLSTIGSRGDVQPLAALAVQLHALGHDVHLCVPPDFREFIEGLGVSMTPIGPEVRSTAKANRPPLAPTREQGLAMMNAMVAGQFEAIAKAAEGCDVIVGATALQVGARSVAESLGIPYVFVAFAPNVLPSPRLAPPVLAMLGQTVAPPSDDYSDLWDEDARRLDATWGPMLNKHRAAIGLAPVTHVREHIFTDQPWLAADPVLGPWPVANDDGVIQTGAWILPDERPLPAELEAFLDAGDPPVYFGFGSIRAPQDLGRNAVDAARALGRRAIVLSGWSNISLGDDPQDCLIIEEVNQQRLFTRVAAIVHHGGAGTTTAAARAGAPQVIVPQHYDQHYWAQRVHELGIGVAHAPGAPAVDSLVAALDHALAADVRSTAHSTRDAIRDDGALVAATRLISLCGG